VRRAALSAVARASGGADDGRRAGLLFGGLALALLSLAPPAGYSYDGASMLAVAESLVVDGDLTVPCGAGVPVAGGACYSSFYLLQSLLLVPFVAAGRLVAGAAGVPADYGGRLAAMALPALCVAGAATMTALLVREVGAKWRTAVAVALVLAFCTEALAYSRTLFAEPLGALALSAAAWGLLARRGRWRWVVGLLAATAVVMTKPQLLLAVPLMAAALAAADRRWRPLVGGLAATGAGSAAVLLYNHLRFGRPFDFGGSYRKLYVGGDADGGSAVVELLDGLAQLLVSPNNGLLVFAPAALLGGVLLVRRARAHRVFAACAGGALGVLLFALIAPNGNAWGTRYLVPLLPLACVGLVAARGRLRHLTVALALVGALVQAPTVLSYFERQYRDARADAPTAWELDRPEALLAWPAAQRQLRDASRTDVEALVREAAADGGTDERLLRTVAVWWWVLPAAGIPALAGALLAVLGALGGGALVRRAARADVRP
jgi:hypothetical protein